MGPVIWAKVLLIRQIAGFLSQLYLLNEMVNVDNVKIQQS